MNYAFMNSMAMLVLLGLLIMTRISLHELACEVRRLRGKTGEAEEV